MRVPTYSEPQVAPEGLPAPNVNSAATPETLGGNAAQLERFASAASRAGADLSAIGQQMQERDDTTAVLSAQTQLQDSFLQYKQSIDQRRGAQADGVTDEANQWFADNITKVSDGLANDNQRRAFAARVAAMRANALATISGYETAQRRQATHDAATAQINTSIALAASSTDPATVGKSKADILSSTAALAKLNGWDTPTALAYGDEQLTRMHLGVIDSMLAQQNTAGAQAYYDANKAEINGLARPKVERALKIGTLKTTAQSFADEMVHPGAIEADVLAAARKKFDGDQEAAAVAEVKTRFAEQSQQRDQNERNAADAAWQHFDQTGQLPSAAVLANMNGRARAELDDYAQKKARGENIVTDWPTYHDLRMLASQQPDTFAKTDLREYATRLAPGQMKELIDMQASVVKPQGLHDVATLQQQLTNMHEQLGWGSSDAQKKGLFDSAATAEINREQAAAKRPLTYDERQKVIDRMAIQRSAPWYNPFGWGASRYYETQGPSRTMDPSQFVPQIPDAERRDIEAALKAHGREVTDDAVMGLYRRAHGLPPAPGATPSPAPAAPAPAAASSAQPSEPSWGRNLGRDALAGAIDWEIQGSGLGQMVGDFTSKYLTGPLADLRVLPEDIGAKTADAFAGARHAAQAQHEAVRVKDSDFVTLTVPDAAAEAIRQEYARRGLKPTDHDVQEVYRAWLRRQGR